MSTREFTVGDRVFATNPVNSSWPLNLTGTVISVPRPGRIDIRWDHGIINYGHVAEDFSHRYLDPFPYVSDTGSRHAHPGTINGGYRLRYDPRSGYDDLTEEQFFELKGWT